MIFKRKGRVMKLKGEKVYKSPELERGRLFLKFRKNIKAVYQPQKINL